MAKPNPGKSVSSITMLLLLLAVAWQQQWLPQSVSEPTPTSSRSEQPFDNAAIERAFAAQRSNVQLHGQVGCSACCRRQTQNGRGHRRRASDEMQSHSHSAHLIHHRAVAQAVTRVRFAKQEALWTYTPRFWLQSAGAC